MEVYIFQKNKRCPYLHYGFLVTEIERYANENLDWETKSEYQVDMPFLYKWLSDVRQRKESYLKDCNETQGLIYQISMDTLQYIIDIVEPLSGENWFEVYLTRF